MKTVLYAEDHERVRRASIRYIAARGYEPFAAENGQIAFDAYLREKEKGRQFDLIITDWEMPVLDGCGLVEKLREAGYSGAIAMKTGRDAEKLKEFAKKHNVLGVSNDIGELLDIYEAGERK